MKLIAAIGLAGRPKMRLAMALSRRFQKIRLAGPFT